MILVTVGGVGDGVVVGGDGGGRSESGDWLW